MTDWMTDDPASLLPRLTYRDVAKTIDHSLLRPELADDFIDENVTLAVEYGVASITCRPVDLAKVAGMLRGMDTDVVAGTVVGFPHGNLLTETKVFETQRALEQGAREIDMVINIGALKSGRDGDVGMDIRAVVDVAHAGGAIVKVIFENAYLTDDEKIRACHVTESAGADFVKTSTGFARDGRHPRGPAPDARQHVAARAGQGGRRRAHARRAAGGDGAGRDAHRRDGDQDDPRRLQGAQGGRGHAGRHAVGASSDPHAY